MVLEVKDITLITPEDKLLLKKYAIIFKMAIITAIIVMFPVVLFYYLAKGNPLIFGIGVAIGAILLYPVIFFYVEPKIKAHIESLPSHTSYL